VTTGDSDGTATEITNAALKDGDRVIVAALAPAASTARTSPAGGRGPSF